MIVATDLQKTYPVAHGQGSVAVLKDVSFTVEENEFYVLLGASGCGKTTTLRSLAGLETPDSGRISINSQVSFSSHDRIFVNPEDRPIAMVFQSYGLWPNMNVRENITFPLRYGNRRVDSRQMAKRLDRVLALLQLAQYAERPIFMLSGGQQQRVALARALALEPAVLLMDEPLSNLDAKLRARLRVELKDLVRSVGITTVYVTHDQAEAMVMGDRIAVMHQGRILQEGSGAELYQRPRTLAVAKFLGEMSFLPGRVAEAVNGVVRAEIPGGALRCLTSDLLEKGDPVEIGFRPEDVRLTGAAGDNAFVGTITARYYLGDAFLYEIKMADTVVTIRLPKSEVIDTGTSVHIQIDPDLCIAFGKEEGISSVS